MSRNAAILVAGLAVFTLVIFLLALSNSTRPASVLPLGTIKIELYPDKAPETVANFLRYVEDGHYDGTIFHRVISDFVIQGGGYSVDLKEKPTRGPIRNEADNGLRNERGTIAMARTADPHSATAQFFINVVDNQKKLDPAFSDGHGYCVFGKVIEGMEVVDRIRTVPTRTRPPVFENLPVQDVIIQSARRDTSRTSEQPPVVILEVVQSANQRR
jgi:cyclophilin family peptidyl-prolyl cis-trans isomerase